MYVYCGVHVRRRRIFTVVFYSDSEEALKSRPCLICRFRLPPFCTVSSKESCGENVVVYISYELALGDIFSALGSEGFSFRQLLVHGFDRGWRYPLCFHSAFVGRKVGNIDFSIRGPKVLE